MRAVYCTAMRALGVTVLVLLLDACSAAPLATEVDRVPSDLAGIELTVARWEPEGDYVAETDSGVPLDSEYARDRGADQGLVELHCVGGQESKRAKAFRIARADIETVVRVTYAMPVLDRTDVVLSRDRTWVVHTTIANAGIFTNSDVYELPRVRSVGEYARAAARRDELCLPDARIVGVALQRLGN
jgi:hypothetical protein